MRKYGVWIGCREGTPENVSQCVVEVWDNTFKHFFQCRHGRGHGEGGVLCRQHAKLQEAGRKLSIPDDESEEGVSGDNKSN